jgi:uncharacterized membrane protein YgaE (UPF0421/DUF939 family)
MGQRGPRKESEIIRETLERVFSMIELNAAQAEKLAQWAQSPVTKLQEEAKAEAFRENMTLLRKMIDNATPVPASKEELDASRLPPMKKVGS